MKLKRTHTVYKKKVSKYRKGIQYSSEFGCVQKAGNPLLFFTERSVQIFWDHWSYILFREIAGHLSVRRFTFHECQFSNSLTMRVSCVDSTGQAGAIPVSFFNETARKGGEN